MKILHLSLWYIPGMGYQENFLPRHQAALGHQVSIVTSAYYPRYFHQRSDQLQVGECWEQGVRCIRVPGVMVGNWSQVYFYKLRETVEGIKPDVVHLHGLWSVPSFQFAWLLPRKVRKGIAVVADDHTDNGNLPTGMGRYFRFAVARLVGSRVIHIGGKLIAVNPFSRTFLMHVLKFPEEHIELLPLGINDEDFFPDNELRWKFRERLQVPERAIVFITSGRLSGGKGFEQLIQAFAKLHHKFPMVRLVIVGGGHKQYQDSLVALSRELGVERNVIFVPWVSQKELNGYYNAADVGVLPGKLGGIKEILAVGKPLIVPDHIATRYFVEDGGGVSFRTEAGLVEAMCFYVENSDKIQEQGAIALRTVRNKLSWRNIARRSIEVYEEVCRDVA